MKIIFNHLTAAFFISVLILSGCKKSADNTEGDLPDESYTPVTYPKGVTEGTAVQKTIDAGGGTLASADGKISITVPAGAVASATNFSIQQISNTVPLGSGPSYRLLPADAVLSKPVTITLKYDDASIDGKDEEALDLVSQDDAGTWRVMNKTILDKNNRTLTVQSTHLKDFSFTGYYYLAPVKTVLGAGEPTTLTVKKISVANDNDGDEETPLGGINPAQNADVEGWELTGPGKVEGGPDGNATYTAPSAINGSSITEIKATIKNIRKPRRLKGKKLRLRSKISIAKDFMAGTYDGQPFTCVGVSVASIGGIMYIQGAVASGKSILILVNGNGLGSYPHGNPTKAGMSEIRCDLAQNKVYETVYTECGPPSVTKYASGAVTIKNFESAGGVVAGEFSATLYNDSGCSITTKKISGAFRTASP